MLQLFGGTRDRRNWTSFYTHFQWIPSNFSFRLFLFHFSPPCTTSKKAKANKKVQVCWNFTHSFRELLLNFFREHFNCNEFHQTFGDQFIGDQNSEYATEMSIFIVFGKILILCILKSFWCVFKIGLRERKFDPRNKMLWIIWRKTQSLNLNSLF